MPETWEAQPAVFMVPFDTPKITGRGWMSLGQL